MSRPSQTYTLLALLVLAPAAWAGPTWGYQSPTNTSVLTPGAGVTFPNTPWADGPADGRIAATPVVQWSQAPAAAPDRVTAEPYSFDLRLKDYATGQTDLLTFKGILDGTIWKDGARLTNAFTGPTTQAVDLGANIYTVTLTGFDPPTRVGDRGAGQVSAQVTVAGADTSAAPPDPAPAGPVAQTPEPATAALGALGLAAVGLARAARRSRPAHIGD